MNSFERKEMRAYMRKQEAMKNPAMRMAMEYSEKKAKEERERQRILGILSGNGVVNNPLAKTEGERANRAKTDEETRREQILKYYG